MADMVINMIADYKEVKEAARSPLPVFLPKGIFPLRNGFHKQGAGAEVITVRERNLL